MFCYKCGAELKEGAMFCGQCGAEVRVSSTKSVPADADRTAGNDDTQGVHNLKESAGNDIGNKAREVFGSLSKKGADMGKSVQSLGRRKIALIMSAVASVLCIVGFSGIKMPQILDAMALILFWVCSVGSMILIRHNLFRDCAWVASKLNIIGRLGGIGGLIAMGIFLLPLALIILFFGAFLVVLGALGTFIIELYFPILPVGYKYLRERKLQSEM